MPHMTHKQATPSSRSTCPRGTCHVSHGTPGHLDNGCHLCQAQPIGLEQPHPIHTPTTTQFPSTASASLPPAIKNKTIATPSSPLLPTIIQEAKHPQPHHIKELAEGHGRRELNQRRGAQARRGGAAGRRRRIAGGEEGAGDAQGRGPARGAPRPGGRLRRHRHHRVGQGRDHRRVPREEQGQQGAERQEEAGYQRRQLCARLHRRVRQLPVPIQLHRLPGPRQAEESAVHQRRPRD